MAHAARKAGPTAKRKPKPAAKPARGVARVKEGARGQLVALASDPEFQRRVAEQLLAGEAAGLLVQGVLKVLERARRAPPVSDDAMAAAAQFMAEVEKHNGPPPSDDEVDEMVRAWA